MPEKKEKKANTRIFYSFNLTGGRKFDFLKFSMCLLP